MIMQGRQTMHKRQFVSPADIAAELGISSSTVLRMIHAGDLPAIPVSARIYRVPAASFELFKAGRLRTPEPAPLGEPKKRPSLGLGETLPTRQEDRPLVSRR